MVMLAPQQPHLIKPVRRVGFVTIRGGTLTGERSASLCFTWLNVSAVMIGSIWKVIHSDLGLISSGKFPAPWGVCRTCFLVWV